MSSTPEFRKAFVKRLVEACDQSKIIPPPFQGRQQVIANRLKVAPEAVSKWFKGVAMPRPDKMRELAKLLEVEYSHLALGIDPEVPRAECQIHARESGGAVDLVRGLITFAGGHVGNLVKGDPRSDIVDFYVTMRGSAFPVRVVLGREVLLDRYELTLPREFQTVRNIGVIPLGSPGKFDFLDLPAEMIERVKTRKGGDAVVILERVGSGKYVTTDGEVWPRIRTFGELA